jgi:hypothetical protein
MWMFAALAAFGADVSRVSVEVGRPSLGIVEGSVYAPLAEVLRLVLDCDGSDGWFPDLTDTRTVREENGSVHCAGQTDLPWPLADREWIIESRPAEIAPGIWEVPFALVPGSAGNVPELHGAYRLEDLGGGRTRVRYDATVDIGFWIPEILAEWATKRVLPAILTGIEEAAGVRQTWLARL